MRFWLINIYIYHIVFWNSVENVSAATIRMCCQSEVPSTAPGEEFSASFFSWMCCQSEVPSTVPEGEEFAATTASLSQTCCLQPRCPRCQVWSQFTSFISVRDSHKLMIKYAYISSILPLCPKHFVILCVFLIQLYIIITPVCLSNA